MHPLILPVLVLLLALPAAAQTPEEKAQEAREHFALGTKAYNLTHYGEAITQFETAFDLKDDPTRRARPAPAARWMFLAWLHERKLAVRQPRPLPDRLSLRRRSLLRAGGQS